MATVLLLKIETLYLFLRSAHSFSPILYPSPIGTMKALDLTLLDSVNPMKHVRVVCYFVPILLVSSGS